MKQRNRFALDSVATGLPYTMRIAAQLSACCLISNMMTSNDDQDEQRLKTEYFLSLGFRARRFDWRWAHHRNEIQCVLSKFAHEIELLPSVGLRAHVVGSAQILF